ncbi:maleylpyruvate isomerase N-terminal domain-containing protein [Actinoplanes solisilvae]|uniref:maleylpyruvate isomerase N-terminal domain-containing protein n=1 Tax=Actinoplanes solisilvae TaxID=2486853 RepID=UPI000FDA2222|nr:maleylpyruvate isomerase N-terminal domain-containing protein [Actinoplanes solisilvae]
MSRAATLASLWETWAAHGAALSEPQWPLPTRLVPWTVRDLFGHTSSWPHGLAYVVTQVRDAPPTHATAGELLREFNAPGGVAHVARAATADRAVADAAQHTPAELVDAFATVGPRALVTVRGLGDVVIDYFGLARLRLDEVLSIGIVEATVHLLDLQRALDVEPSVPAAALEHTVAVLSPVAVIEAATGRGGPVLS